MMINFSILIILFNLISFASAEIDYVITDCNNKSFWKHKAYEDSKGNFSILEIEKNMNLYCGIELDLIFDSNLGVIYIAHDPIFNEIEIEKRNIEKLSKKLKNFKGGIWLDWKNYSFIGVFDFLELITKNFNHRNKSLNNEVLIETPNSLLNELISFLSPDEISVINWLSVDIEKEGTLKKLFRMLKAYFYSCFRQNVYISTPNVHLIDICERNLSNKYFFFTENDFDNAVKIFELGYSVILTDNLKQKKEIMGRETGLEPATTGITIRGSTN